MLTTGENESSSLDKIVRLSTREAVRHKWKLVLAFVLICGTGVGTGLLWPETYSSSMTIDIEQQNIIDPLMKGRAERTKVTDWVNNAKQVVHNRSLLRKVAERTGRITDATSPKEQERVINALRQSTAVDNPGDNLVRITYTGGDPQRVYNTTQTFGQVMIDDILERKARESAAAYRFIDQQVSEYEDKLKQVQEKLKEQREKSPVAQPGAFENLNKRQLTLQNTIDELEQQLSSARIRADSMQKQLAGEVDSAAVTTREDRLRERLRARQEKLAELRLQYKDSYPDIVALKKQIAALGQEIQQAKNNGSAGEPAEDTNQGNSVSQELQGRLYETKTDIRTLNDRLARKRNELERTRKRTREAQDIRSKVEELERDYQVNQKVYQDLLKRRENARVSKNLDTGQKGLTIRKQEEAYLPHTPAGPRLLHFALAGGVLGIAVPLGCLLMILGMDSRVRLIEHLPEVARTELIGTIPWTPGRMQRHRERFGLALAIVICIAFVAGLSVLMWVKVNGGLL